MEGVMTKIRIISEGGFYFLEGNLGVIVEARNSGCAAYVKNNEFVKLGLLSAEEDYGEDYEWCFHTDEYEIVDEQMEAHILKLESAPTAASILQSGLSHMEDRASTYDNDEGERSIPATVAAFNAITGHELTAEQGWLFMSVLKMVRSQQGEFKPDNYEDLAAYAGLMGEQACQDRCKEFVDPDAEFDM